MTTTPRAAKAASCFLVSMAALLLTLVPGSQQLVDGRTRNSSITTIAASGGPPAAPPASPMPSPGPPPPPPIVTAPLPWPPPQPSAPVSHIARIALGIEPAFVVLAALVICAVALSIGLVIACTESCAYYCRRRGGLAWQADRRWLLLDENSNAEDLEAGRGGTVEGIIAAPVVANGILHVHATPPGAVLIGTGGGGMVCFL